MAHETKSKAPARGRIDRAKVERTTEAEVECHAVQDEEAEWFDPKAAPERVVRPFRPRCKSPAA